MMAVNDVTKLAFIHSMVGADGDIIVTHHYRQTQAGSANYGVAEAVEALVDFWQAIAQQDWLFSQSDRLVLESIQARSITDPTIGFDRAVGAAGDLPPVGLGTTSLRVAPVVSLRTGLIGRSFRGRNFLPPPNETDIENGALEASLVALIDEYYDTARILTDSFIPTATLWQMTIYSPTLSEVAGVPVDNLVTTHLTRGIAGTQRGRQRVA
jgi:hypothetical protein